LPLYSRVMATNRIYFGEYFIFKTNGSANTIKALPQVTIFS